MSSQPIEDGGPAFPQTTTTDGKADFPWDGYGRGGMSLRDYFALGALQGLLADQELNGEPTDFAACAYRYADAMLAARAPKPEATA